MSTWDRWRPLSAPARIALEFLVWHWAAIFITEAWLLDWPMGLHVLAWVTGLPAGLALWYDNCRRVGMRPWRDRPRD